MTHGEKRKEELLRRNLPKFVDKLDPVELLQYLPCLTKGSMEKIKAAQRNDGPRNAVMELYQNLIRMNNWCEELTAALRDPGINQSELADILDPKFCDQEPQINTVSDKSKPVTAHTSFRELNQSVLEALTLLDHEGSLTNWRDLASILDYNIEQVQKIESRQSGSCTRRLLKDWMKYRGSNLGALLQALEIIQREDLISKVEELTNYKHPRSVNIDICQEGADNPDGCETGFNIIGSDDVILFHPATSDIPTNLQTGSDAGSFDDVILFNPGGYENPRNLQTENDGKETDDENVVLMNENDEIVPRERYSGDTLPFVCDETAIINHENDVNVLEEPAEVELVEDLSSESNKNVSPQTDNCLQIQKSLFGDVAQNSPKSAETSENLCNSIREITQHENITPTENLLSSMENNEHYPDCSESSDCKAENGYGDKCSKYSDNKNDNNKCEKYYKDKFIDTNSPSVGNSMSTTILGAAGIAAFLFLVARKF